MIHKLFDNLDYFSLIAIILTIYVTQYYYKYFTRVNPLPGPLPFPFVGNLPQLIWQGGNIKNFFELNHQKYGEIFEVYLDTRIIILGRAEYAEKIFSSSLKDPYVKKVSDDTKGYHELGVLNKGIIFNQDYKTWKYNRHFFSQAILSPKFTREAIDLTNKLFNELDIYWNKLYLKEENIKGNKNGFDVSKWFNQFTNDMIIALLTGERSYTMAGYFNLFSDEKSKYPTSIVDDSVELVQAMRKHALGFMMFQFVSPFLRHYVPGFKNKADNLLQNKKYMDQKIDTIIKRRRQEIGNTPLDKPLPNDILTLIINANTSRDEKAVDETLKPMTDEEIRVLMFDGIIAGTDTTANTISYIIYYLYHNPIVKKKMFDEIDAIFHDDKMRPITESDFHKLKYCEAIVKEVSRIFPVATSVSRYLERPDEIAGYQWPAGTTVRINIDAIHHNKDHWDEPDKFNPDRWMVEGFEPAKNTFDMFGGGLRKCPGRKLAITELVCLMALIFRKYDIDLIDKESPLKTESTSTVTACIELLVAIKPRN